jgi:hypothetical protein
MDKINKAKTLFGYTCKRSEIFTAVRMWTNIQEFWFQKASRWELYPFQTQFPRRQVPTSYHILRYKRRIKAPFTLRRSRGSSVSIVSDYGLDDRVIGVRSPAGAKDFPLASVSRPVLRPTQPPIQWLPGVLSPGQSAAGAWRWPVTPIYCRGQEWVGAIHPLPPSATMACSGTALLLFTLRTTSTLYVDTFSFAWR